MKRIIGYIVLLCGIVLFVWWFYGSRTEEYVPADYKNIEYVIEGENVMLRDGVSVTAGPEGSIGVMETRFFGNESRGDLNADGVEDVAFLVTQELGGTATFFYAVAALSVPGTAGRIIGTNGIFLGDRIAPQTTEIRNGKIVVNYAQRPEGAPFSESPSVGVTTYIDVEHNTLRDVTSL